MLGNSTAQKMKFSIKDSYSKCYQILNEEILNRKLNFLYSAPYTSSPGGIY